MPRDKKGRGDNHDGIDIPADIKTIEDVAGSEFVEVECTTPRGAPELCDGWGEIIELDEPAYVEDERLYLPGFSWECPDCGQPYEFRVDGVEVSKLV